MKTTVRALGGLLAPKLARLLLVAAFATLPIATAYGAVTVTLTAPANGAVFTAGSNITLSATASATQGYTVSKVEFFHGGTNLIGTDTSSPYSITWTNVPAGSYTLTAKATAIKKNNPDQTATSAPVSITVNALPTVSMTSPSGGAVFAAPGSMTLTATASDADGTIQKVEFFHGGTNLIATVTSSPYTYNWTGVAVGSYSLTAKATDNLNGATTSSPVAVTVTNAPTVTLTSPANNSIYGAPANVTLAATASDTDGIQKVEFFHGGTNLIATVTSSPYTYAWTNVAVGSYSLTAKATDNLGIPTTSSPVSITVSSLAPAGLYYIHPDHLNTPRQIYNDQQQLAWRWDQQEPFGSSPPNDNPAGIGTFEFPLRFPGQYADKETNLAYNYHRDYDSGIGRYVEADPLGTATTWPNTPRTGLNHLYAYATSDVLRRVDPMGLLVWTGTYHSRGATKPVGANVIEFDLMSPCVDNQRAIISVVAVGPAVAIGPVASETYGDIAFEDHLDRIAPTSFNGTFMSASAGVIVGDKISISLGRIRLGRAFQIGGGNSRGFEVGAGLAVGTSTVTKVEIECCTGK